MNLNGISCGGYDVSSRPFRFSLYDTDLTDISALDKTTLTLTIDSEHQYTFGGFKILSIDKQGSSYTVLFDKKLDDATKASIEALEMNLANLTQVTQASIMSLATVTDPVPSLLMRANLTDDEAVTYISAYPEWQVGFDYKKDWIIRHGEDLYRIGQDHTSHEQWVPGADGTTALYSKIDISEDGYETWQEWDGVSGAYAKDQVVRDPTDEQLYKSLIDNNVWGPPSKQPNYWDLYEA